MSLDALLQRRAPTTLEQFKRDPLIFLARTLYRTRAIAATPTQAQHPTSVRVVCISDTHSHHAELGPLPHGDILIHAGDLTHSGTLSELRSALEWLAAQPHEHKVFVAGNHDHKLSVESYDRDALLESFPTLVYLQESAVEIHVEGRALLVYGSPFTPKQGSWPFQYPRHAADWSSIPPATDILITHGPPACHLDGEEVSGCRQLLDALWRVRPSLHVCGHIHAARGVEHLVWSSAQAAFDRICSRRGGWWDLLVLIFAPWFNRPQPPLARTTLLVNASSIGGFRDEQRRGAVVVDI